MEIKTQLKTSTNNILNRIKCTVCDDMFPNKTELSTHKIKSHKSWKLCNKFFNTDVNIKCLHNPCHFSHVPPSEGMHRCYDCGREFHVLEELMLHRKAIHNAVCRMSLTGDCERNQETCWFNHPIAKHQQPAQSVENVEGVFSNNQETDELENVTGNLSQGFQETPPQESPNLSSQEMNKMMDHVLKTLKSDMAQMFKNMMSHR